MTIDLIYLDLIVVMRKLHALSYDTDDRLLVSNMLRAIRRFIHQIDDARAIAIAVSE